MSNNDDKLRKVVESASKLGLGAVVPEVYNDAVKPAAKEIGKGLETLAKTINVALSPISGLVWGYEQIEAYINNSLLNKLDRVSTDNITSPQPNIAGPLLESLRFTGYQEELREMYANLLATSMDKDTLKIAHPSFVEIIKQLSPDEAKLLSHINSLRTYPEVCSTYVNPQWAKRHRVYRDVAYEFQYVCKNANLDSGDLYSNYLDNLRRLLLLEFKQETSETKIEKSRVREDYSVETETREYIVVTDYGQQFISACLYSETS